MMRRLPLICAAQFAGEMADPDGAVADFQTLISSHFGSGYEFHNFSGSLYLVALSSEAMAMVKIFCESLAHQAGRNAADAMPGLIDKIARFLTRRPSDHTPHEVVKVVDGISPSNPLTLAQVSNDLSPAGLSPGLVALVSELVRKNGNGEDFIFSLTSNRGDGSSDQVKMVYSNNSLSRIDLARYSP